MRAVGEYEELKSGSGTVNFVYLPESGRGREQLACTGPRCEDPAAGARATWDFPYEGRSPEQRHEE